MKKSLFFTLLVLLLCRCTIDPHDITSEYGPIPGRTALEYAYECEETLGPLPRFSFDDAIEVPTTKNGIQLNSDSSNYLDCDHPWAFGMACQTGNKIGRYQGINSDGSENLDVVFITFFRDGGLGVIGNKISTGETCFFSILDGVENNNLPIPGESGYNEKWMTPSAVAADKCVDCHMSSPFLHTPAVDQLQHPQIPNELLVPLTSNQPYSVVGQEFGQPKTALFTNNQCTACHRPQCTSHFQNYPLDELKMPAPFLNATNFDHSNIATMDRQEIREWCKTLGLDLFTGSGD
jgi:hypothetical protein|tara:strand:+ start:926 stop:1801 length:876 start_codon:yes stop_codon:yes gene_type:complete